MVFRSNSAPRVLGRRQNGKPFAKKIITNFQTAYHYSYERSFRQNLAILKENQKNDGARNSAFHARRRFSHLASSRRNRFRREQRGAQQRALPVRENAFGRIRNKLAFHTGVFSRLGASDDWARMENQKRRDSRAFDSPVFHPRRDGAPVQAFFRDKHRNSSRNRAVLDDSARDDDGRRRIHPDCDFRRHRAGARFRGRRPQFQELRKRRENRGTSPLRLPERRP